VITSTYCNIKSKFFQRAVGVLGFQIARDLDRLQQKLSVLWLRDDIEYFDLEAGQWLGDVGREGVETEGLQTYLVRCGIDIHAVVRDAL
jgi:hypothetical protein